MTMRPPRRGWRWGLESGGSTGKPRLSVTSFQSRLASRVAELTARLSGRDPGTDAEAPTAVPSFVFKLAPGAEQWNTAAGRGIIWNRAASRASILAARLACHGDEAILFQEGAPSAIVAVARVSRASHPAPGDLGYHNPAVELAGIRFLEIPVSLTRIRSERALHDCALVRIPALTVIRISPQHRQVLRRMGVR